jgi:putative oxidoreductase
LQGELIGPCEAGLLRFLSTTNLGERGRKRFALPPRMDTSANSPAAAPGGLCLICLSRRGYCLLIKASESLQSPLLLALRLYWGWQFFLTGKGKLMNLERTTNFFQSLHIPLPHLNAWIVGLSECLGGLLLLTGFGARLVGALLAFDMIVAYLTADIDKIKHIFDEPDKFVSADPFLFMLASLIVVAFGPGKFSIDWIIRDNHSQKNKAPRA